MQSDKHDKIPPKSRGLNFVFESAGHNDNRKYIRSHAAKVGWSQRSRKKEVAAQEEDSVNDPTPSTKRRKTSEQSRLDQPPAQQSAGFVIIEDLSAYRRHTTTSPAPSGPPIAQSLPSPPQLTGPPPVDLSQSFGPNVCFNPEIHHRSTVFPGPSSSVGRHPAHPNTFFAAAHEPPYGLVRSRPSSPVWRFPSHPSEVRNAVRPSLSTESTPSASPANCNPSYVFARPVVSLRSRDALPSPAPSPPHGILIPSSTQSYSTPPRQCERSDLTVSRSRRCSHSDTEQMETSKEPEDSAECVLRTPPQSRVGSPSFLDVVLNTEHPLCPSIDSGKDSFGVFPVKWQPFYSRLLENYRSNMLVQLEEITTGWTLEDRVEFNQMPLRLAMGEPALFYALLAAASTMMPPGLISPSIPQWLQNRTAECLNRAFSDPTRAYSDATILTVNLIALIESTGGQATKTKTLHQPVLRKMVDLRGGLENLLRGESGTAEERDTRNFVRFLAWTDRVIWCQTGNPLIFEDFREDATVTGTDWDDIWERMTVRVEANRSAPVEEVLD